MLRPRFRRMSVAISAVVALATLPAASVATTGPRRWSTHGPPGAVRSLAISPQASRTVYAGTEKAGLFKSVTAAQRWSYLDTPITPSDVWVNAIALSVDPATVYVGT